MIYEMDVVRRALKFYLGELEVAANDESPTLSFSSVEKCEEEISVATKTLDKISSGDMWVLYQP